MYILTIFILRWLADWRLRDVLTFLTLFQHERLAYFSLLVFKSLSARAKYTHSDHDQDHECKELVAIYDQRQEVSV